MGVQPLEQSGRGAGRLGAGGVVEVGPDGGQGAPLHAQGDRPGEGAVVWVDETAVVEHLRSAKLGG